MRIDGIKMVKFLHSNLKQCFIHQIQCAPSHLNSDILLVLRRCSDYWNLHMIDDFIFCLEAQTVVCETKIHYLLNSN